MSDIILNIVISFVVSILVVRLGVRFSSWTGIRRFQNLIPNLKTIVVCYIPISVLFFCCWFFRYAFDKTVERGCLETPSVIVNVSSNIQSNSVVSALYSADFQSKLKNILICRESIVAAEHDRFRAEMSSWLSIFGLLSILATIVFAAASYLMQQMSLKDEKRSIDLQFGRLRREIAQHKKDIQVYGQGVRKNIEQQTSNAAATINTTSAGAVDGKPTADASETVDMREIRQCQYKFMAEWPSYEAQQENRKDAFQEKIEHGISFLRHINEKLEAKNSPEIQLSYLNLLNGINVYWGKVVDEEFKRWFVEALCSEKPLTLAGDELKRSLNGIDEKEKNIAVGYYMKMYEMQKGNGDL